MTAMRLYQCESLEVGEIRMFELHIGNDNAEIQGYHAAILVFLS